MNITLITNIDCAQYGEQLYKSLSRYTSYAVSNINGESTHEETYIALKNADIVWVTNDYLAQIKNGKLYIQIANQINKKNYGISVNNDALLIGSPSGGYYRRHVEGYEPHSKQHYSLKLYRENYDVVAPSTPDMIYPGMDNLWLPLIWQAEDYNNMWKERHNKIRIGCYHGMGKEDRKGVEKYLLPAIAKAKNNGIEIELVYFETCFDKSQKEYIRMISACDICFEEISPIGVYGSCGVQQMSIGIPSIVSIGDDAAKKARPIIEGYGSPCIRAYSIDDLVSLFADIAGKRIDLGEISRASREYALKYHGYEATAKTAKLIIEVAQEKARLGVGRDKNAPSIEQLYHKDRSVIMAERHRKATGQHGTNSYLKRNNATKTPNR